MNSFYYLFTFMSASLPAPRFKILGGVISTGASTSTSATECLSSNHHNNNTTNEISTSSQVSETDIAEEKHGKLTPLKSKHGKRYGSFESDSENSENSRRRKYMGDVEAEGGSVLFSKSVKDARQNSIQGTVKDITNNNNNNLESAKKRNGNDLTMSDADEDRDSMSELSQEEGHLKAVDEGFRRRNNGND